MISRMSATTSAKILKFSKAVYKKKVFVISKGTLLRKISCMTLKNKYNYARINKQSYVKENNKKSMQQLATQLSSVIQQQISSQSANLYDKSHFINLLQMINWKISKNNSTLQLTKTTQTHSFHAFITIKPPIEMNQQNKSHRIQQKKLQMQILEQQLKKKSNPSMKKHLQHIKKFLQQNPFQQPFAQITIFIQKLNPKSKYLCIEYLSNSKHSEIEQISLLSKIVPSRIQRIQECHQYDGRPLAMQDIQKTEMIFLLTQTEYELRKQVLQTMFQLTCCYQQLQYIQWLKNFNQLL